MKIIDFLLFAGGLTGMTWGFAKTYIWLRDRQPADPNAEWEVRERTLPGKQYGLFLVRAGEDAQLYGEPISQNLPEHEFQEVLTERRLGARERVREMNDKTLLET